MVGGPGDREDGAVGGKIQREYRGGGGRGSGRYRRGIPHRHSAIGERRGPSEGGHMDDEMKGDTEKLDVIKHRPHKDLSRGFSEDSRISKQLRRLSREDDAERYLAQVQQLQESIMLNENVKYVRRNADHILDSLFESLHAAPSPPCRWEITRCIGRVGHVMEGDIKRFVELTLDRLETWRAAEMKVLVLRCILEMLRLDSDGTQVSQVGSKIVEGLQGVLEGTETPEVMVAIVDVLRELNVNHSHILDKYFQDIVDILVGWHIDHHQSPEVMKYVSVALSSFSQLWLMNVPIAATLLSQFVEDMEDYCEDLERGMSGRSSPEDEASTDPIVCAKKVAAFISVFTTVLHCLGPQADPTINPSLSSNFLVDSLGKMVVGATKILKLHWEEALLDALNQVCIVLIPYSQTMTGLQDDFYKVVDLQEDLVGHLAFGTTFSYLTLVNQMLKQIGSSLSVAFIQKLLGVSSPLRALRLSPHRQVWQATLAVYHAILSLKNVPLLQEAYNYILADLQVAHQVLVPKSKTFSTSTVLDGVTYKQEEAIIILMYYMTVLAEVANTRNSIITMWALTPPLVDLLATHLTPADPHLALHYPEVQHAVLYLLYSHCAKHSHYVSSSTLIVGASSPFVPPTVSTSFSGGSPGGFSSGSSTSENLATILITLTTVLRQRRVTGANIIQLCLEWAADVVRSSETSLPQLMKIKVFTDMIDAVVQTGYHHQNCVTSSVAACLSKIFTTLPPTQMQSLDEVIKLCLHHVSHNDSNICSVFLDLLARLPLSAVSHALCMSSTQDEMEYSGNKGDGSSNVEFGSLDSSSLKSLERHFVLRSTSGHLPTNAFHTLMTFILHVSQPKGEYWQEDLFAISQRVERMAKAEDWSLPVLASHLRTLLWKWLTWEPAQHCIANKLRTSLGKPQDTFTNIEGAIKSRAKEVRECSQNIDKNQSGSKGSEDQTSGKGNGSEKTPADSADVKVHSLAVTLLVEFLESLEKAMFNASDGCAVALPPPNKSVRAFFRTNRQTCTEWLSRIRAAVIVVALNSGRPEVAIRHSYKLLQELKDNNNTQSNDFERAVCYCARALLMEGSDEGVAGLYYWCRDHIGRRFTWLKPAIYSAGNKYEKALKGFLQFLDGGEEVEEEGDKNKSENEESSSHHPSSNIQLDIKQVDPLVQEFIYAQIAEAYSKLSQWGELQKWTMQVWNKYNEPESSTVHSGLLNTYKDLSYVQALAHFDSADPVGVMTSLNGSVNLVDWSKGNEWVMWKKLHNINTVLLYSFTSTVYPQPNTLRESIGKLVSECEEQVEWLMQLSTLSSYNNIHLQLLLLHQVLHELKSILNDSVGVGRLHEGWENTNLMSLPADLIPHVSRWSKLIARLNLSITPTSITKLDLLSAKQARKQENMEFAESTLIGLLGSVSSTLSESVLEVLPRAEFNPLQAKLHREAAKMLANKGNVSLGCTVLAGVVAGLNPSLSALAQTDTALLKLPPNEAGHLCARSIITLNKWWAQDEKRLVMVPAGSSSEVPCWMDKLYKVYMEMKKYSPEELQPLADVNHSTLPILEKNIGHILTLAATQCPTLPKVWFHVASWCFRWGRKILEHNSKAYRQLSKEDESRVQEILSVDSAIGQDKIEEMCRLLSNWKPGQDSEDDDEEDLRLEEVEGPHQVGNQIISTLQTWGISSSLVPDLSNQLVEVHSSIQERHYTVLTTAAKAYFRFLKISQGHSVSHADQCTIATLRLLRLIVKHASELRGVLEMGLAETPTRPWKTIIPQLFSRLNHPEPYVRGSISELLCRLAEDFPHLIVFPAVVGSAGGNVTGNQASLTDMLAKYLHKGRHVRKIKQALGDEEEDEDEEEEEYDQVEEDEEEEEEEEELLSESTEEQERRTLMRNCFSALVDTLTKQIGSSISEVQMLVHELRRITVLWDELWLGTLAQHHSDMSRKCHQLTAEIARLNNNSSLSQIEKTQLIKKKYNIIFKPLLFVLDQLADITSTPPETPHERHFHDTYGSQISTALSNLREPESYFDPQSALSGLKQLHQQMLQQRAHRRASSTLKMCDVSPKLANLISTKIAMPGVVSSSQQVVTIASVDGTISILPTKTKPKKLSFQGSDGKKYTYLFKGLEDLHLDERIMQFLEIVNTMLAKNQRGKDCIYRARYYSVVPLGPRSGLIQWVGNATPLFGLYKRWQQREAHALLLKTHSSAVSIHPQAPPQVPRPSELYYSKLTPRLREAGVSIDNRKEWPLAILRDVLKDLIKETPSNLLSRELWMCSVSAGDWWRLTQTYSISTAVMSIIGYIIGLGDRHLDNVLVNLTSGEVVHIDYNVCFEKGKNLRVPERVPYRMTHNIEAALGVTGTEGVFRSACEQVLRAMRRGRETLLTLLEAFIYDPLVDWTPDSESGYAGAVYGGDQALNLGARQSRQQLERGLTLSMFAVRMAEMKADWLHNKMEVLEAIPNVEANLMEWQKSNEALSESGANLQDGHNLMAMLKEAEANPQHSLYGLRPRYEEFAVVKKAIEHSKELVNSRLIEVKHWHTLYLSASRVFEGGQLGEWRSKLSGAGSFLASVSPVSEFLTKAGQGQLATQCEHTEVELGKVVNQVQNILGSSLDLLVKYGSVWVNYPADHMSHHRLTQQQIWLTSLLQDFTLNNVQTVINKSHREAPETSLVSHVRNIDLQLHNKALQVTSQIQKVYERMRAEGLSDGVAVVNSVHETSLALTNLVTDHGMAGVAAMTCALLNSLTQLTGARLRADKTAAGTREGLVDLTIGGLWWLRESMVTLGGMVELVTLLTTHSPPTFPQETPVIQAISALHDVFATLHELVLNTSGIIIVEGVRLFWRGEPSVISLAKDLQSVIDNAHISPTTLCQQLTTHLRQMILLMPPRHEEALQEATELHSQLMEVINQITSGGNSEISGEMSQGQMLLMGFHLLFEAVETQLDQLMEALSLAPLPQPWPRVDTAREASEIMAPLLDPALRQVFRTLLRVKKVQTIVEFFTTAYQSSPSCRKEESSNGNGSGSLCDEERLQRIVRKYASDCVSLLLLGLPSHLSTHLLLLHCQKLGINVTGYIEARDVGTEGRVSLAGVVQEALDSCMTQHGLDPALPASAATTLMHHLNAVRKKLLLRHWEGEADGLRTTHQRVTAQHLGHQWYYEDILKQNAVAPAVQPGKSRGTLLGELRGSVSTLHALHQNISELREKYTNLTGNVEQRLKWAAGSNPTVAQALEEFSGGVEVAISSVSDLVQKSEEVASICNTVLHYEALRTHTVDAITWDSSFTKVLNSCRESCMLMERYHTTVNPQEEVLVSLCPLSGDVNTKWIQNASVAVSDHIEHLTKLVGERSAELKKASDNVRSSVVTVRTHLTTHHKFMSDIRALLKTMAKFEEHIVSGVEDYLLLYRNYSESISGLIRQMLHDPLTPDKALACKQKFQELAGQTGMIYDQLVDFGNQCVVEEAQEEEEAHREGSGEPRRPPLLRQSSVIMSPAKTSTPDSRTKIKRHPLTGKVVQEHNAYALNVWRRVKVKLEGRDLDATRRVSVSEQADYTIREATNLDNLATLYEGWTPWV